MKYEVQDAVADLRKAIQGSDIEAIQTISQRAAAASQKMGIAVVRAAQAERQQPDETKLISEEEAE